MAFDWPGNVRQLRNVVESMVVVDYDGLLDVDDLPEELAPAGDGETSAGGRRARWPARPGRQAAGRAGNAVHRRNAPVTGGNREEAAEMLGIGERTLYRKIKEYGL